MDTYLVLCPGLATLNTIVISDALSFFLLSLELIQNSCTSFLNIHEDV